MSSLFFAIITQSLTFLPLALGISVSYRILRATDMTIDGSFVLGAAVFARMVTLGFSPVIAGMCALLAGALAGVMVSFIQRGGRVDPLLAGVLATFILTSLNLVIMTRPNINLLSQTTLLSDAFARSDLNGWLLVAGYCAGFFIITGLLLSSRFGLLLRALGDNPSLLKRMGQPIELYRCAGFALTNTLSAAAGCLTAQTVGYADIGMGFGMTLTGIGAIILGQQIISIFLKKNSFRLIAEISACLCGVLLYFFAMNALLRFDIDPVYLKMVLGLVLIMFIRTATQSTNTRNLT